MRLLMIGISVLVLRLAAGCGPGNDGPGDSGLGDAGQQGDGGAGDGGLDGAVPDGPPGIAFEVTTPYPSNFSGQTALVDVTGDGILDVVGPNHWDDTIDVLPGDGHGGFLAAISSPAGLTPGMFAIGDLDGDGDADVAVGNSSQITDNVRWFKNDGTGHFSNPTKLSVLWCGGVWIVDIDNNGKPDLIVDRNSTLDIYLQGPGGLAATAVSTPIPSSTNRMQLADFSGDGKLDLGIISTSGSTIHAGLCPGLGDGHFSSCTYTDGPAAPLNPQEGAAQLDGNASFDYYVDAADDSTAVFAGGPGGFTLAPPVAAPGILSVRSFTAGSTPLFVGTSERFTFEVLGNGGAGLARRVRYSGSGSPIGLGDLDGDGRLDLVSNNGFDVEVALGHGDGTFRAAQTNKVDDSSNHVFTADLDGDARPDVVTLAVSSGGAYSVRIQRQTAPGVFTDLPALLWPGGPVDLKAIDVNGDHTLDLVAWTVNLGVWKARIGNGDGTFGAPLTITDYRYTSTLVDLGVGASYVRAANGGVEIRNGAAGAWTAVPGLLTIYAYRVVDIDGDGKQDLVVSQMDNQSQPSLALLRGKGDGTFELPHLTSVPFVLSSWTVGDIDGDGDQDILSSGSPVQILRAQGTGTFAAPTPLTGVDCSSVTLADFDHDTKLDMFCAVHSSYGRIYAGSGTGTFTKVQSVGGAPASLAIAEDLDGDGKPDLIGSGSGFTWRAHNISH